MRVALLMLLLLNLLMSQEPNFKKCYENNPATNNWMQCAYSEYDYWDKKLNSLYRQVKNKLPKEEIHNLVTAQRAWIKFRDTECYLEAYEMRGGSAEKQLNIGCKISMTEKRVKELYSFLP
ncbi:lysozyme inhibitor LprI family protein [Sulfurovum sp. NBC37-1]|uniref:lysozyme inhibitor LprI family protein n=1 Tax=Sulfurovum sp. (strain NBC37-1) TaxID=387093 RepID=UPI00015878AC|nr:lysozyme inhibitor LprI family protein [Sulfurovum sp. NBC37-1]BAF71699.1 conserved hypothetical protein [Sulfurovum sp. NBC37-1]